MNAKGRTPLAEFAAANRPRTGYPCWMCGIPERDEAEQAHFAGIPQSTILLWLQAECGYGKDVATPNKVGGHLRRHATASG